MKIAYLGPISLGVITAELSFSSVPRPSKLQYPYGAKLVLGLVRAGHKMIVITPSEKVGAVERYVSPNCVVYSIPQRRSRYQMLTFFHREVTDMVQCLRDEKPDVCFSQWLYQYSRAALISGFPTLCVGRDSPWKVARLMGNFRFWFRAVYSCLFVAGKVKHLSTISPHMGEDLKAWWRNGRGENISIVPNAGVMPLASQPRAIIEDAQTIACVSGWSPLKNLKALIAAYLELKQHHPTWRLVIFGSSVSVDEECGRWLKDQYFKIPAGLELRGYGSQNEIREFLLHEADVFCSPTLEESFGMVFVDAMSCGVPCVGGEKSGAVPWVLGDAGILCDVTKPPVLAAALERLMLDGNKRRALARKGMKRVRENFLMSQVLCRYENILKKIAKAG